MTEPIYRHEYKIELNPMDVRIIQARLRAGLQHDPNAGESGEYHIRSLYFDNYGDKALLEKVDGVDIREKFRIRCYNLDFNEIHLEKKSKYKGMGNKLSATVTKEEVASLIKGDTEWMKYSDQALVIELYSKMKNLLLRPRVIVDYVREPFVYGPGNVRITLDKQIKSSVNSINMLNPDVAMVTIPDNPTILEVKFDRFLPDIVKSLIGVDNRTIGEFSKYEACRLYSV